MSQNIYSKNAVKILLNQKNLAPRHSLGQNFLTDKNILDKIVTNSEINKADLILEIGAGLGILTEALLKVAGRVVAVELDKGLFSILEDKFLNQDHLKLINQDIMNVNLSDVLETNTEDNFFLKVVANLPYYITTPVIFKLLESNVSWNLIILLVQKEVADRICSKPGSKEYGALTVMLNFYGNTERVAIVPKTVFYPTPKVDSTIIKIKPLSRPEGKEIYPYLRRVVQASFGQRRKTILNALAVFYEIFGSKRELADFLVKININPESRGETIDVSKFLQLAREIHLRELQT
jgi:16S rRNA (adenine1518-N6/adenine1519-N6)-dimethyltransferase